MKWLIANWIAVVALVVAIVGGVPGILKIIEYFRPVSLSGSIKFFANTSSVNPPEDGILIAVSLVNEGTKNLVWRRIEGTIKAGGNKIALIPKLIPNTLLLPSGVSPQPDLLNQQTIPPGTPVNAYLLLTATRGSLAPLEPILNGKIVLLFEMESGRTVDAALAIQAHIINKGENFPSHGIEFE